MAGKVLNIKVFKLLPTDREVLKLFSGLADSCSKSPNDTINVTGIKMPINTIFNEN